jgi:hypothetical protein
MSPTLPIVVFLLSSALYMFIGMRLGEKTYSNSADAFAWRAFRFWWFGMGTNAALNTLSILTLSMNITALPVFIFFSISATLAASLALWGLLTYLIYVFTGKDRSRLVAAFYIAFALFLFYSIYSFQPTGVAMGEWQVAMQYANTPQGAQAFVYAVGLILLLGLPPVVASIGMFLLFLRIKERSSKYRAALVSAGIFMLFGLTYIVPLILYPFGLRTGDISWWPVATRIVGLAALVIIYFAYFPPESIQKRLKVATVLG